MQAIGERLSDDHVRAAESEVRISEDVKALLRLNEEGSCSQKPTSDHRYNNENDDVYVDASESEDEDEDEEEFSFVFEGANTTPITAEDAFMNGKIKPSCPNLKMEPQVKKVFVQIKDDDGDAANQRRRMPSASSENDEISGPYCEWSKNVSKETSSSSADRCKKSNSTGFSKLWRFKEFRNRSNSDGRDAYVFLNNNPIATTSSSRGNGEVKVNGGKGNVSSRDNGEVKTNGEKGKRSSNSNGEIKGKGEKDKIKKGGKPLSAHEVYLKNKANEDHRRKSYLPYRQEVVGFFTNVNGGLSKNVHPF